MRPPIKGPQGLLLVDKPAGPTTYDLIRWLKRKTGPMKLGHSGTLDPAATGLVILLLGREATRRQAEFMGKDKTYLCDIQLGVKTDTGDLDGKVLETAPVPEMSQEKAADALKTFEGPREQTPPMYSAVKHKGQPLYKLARKGIEVERKSKTITIHSMEFLSHAGDSLKFRCRVSSGTYVRVLAEEIGEALGTLGALRSLRRESIGSFSAGDALPGEDLKALSPEEILSKVRPIVAYA